MQSYRHMITASSKCLLQPQDSSLIDFLDGVQAIEGFKSIKRKAIELMELKSGDNVLDVGCGIGSDVLAMCGVVGQEGKSVGIDISPALIEEAVRRAEGIPPAQFYVKDIYSLRSLDLEPFDASKADRVFQHLSTPAEALSEMVRVSRRGARVVVTEPDWSSLKIGSSYEDLTQRLVDYYRSTITNASIASELPSLFREASIEGIEDLSETVEFTDYGKFLSVILRSIVTQAVNSGALTEREAATWTQDVQDLDTTGRFFATLDLRTIYGTVS